MHASFKFSKIRQIDYLWHFQGTFVDSKCKRSSLRSQYYLMILFCDFQTLWIGRPQFPTIKTTIGSLSNLKREELEAFNLVIKTPQEVLTRKSEDFRCLAALKNCVVKTLNFVQGVPTSLEYAKCNDLKLRKVCKRRELHLL